MALVSVVAISGSAGWMGVLGGCSRSDSRDSASEQAAPSSSDAGPTTREVNADWNDVEAAAWAGAEEAEATLRTIDRTRSSEGVLMFDLRTIRDQSGTLLVVRTADGRGEDHEGARVRLECVVGDGPLRDRPTERRLIDRVARRLDHLLGIEFAPVR